VDGVHRALLVADPAAGAAVVVEPVPVPGAELDHRVLRAGPEAAVALEAVPAGQAAARLIDRLVRGQPAGDLAEVGPARRYGTFGLNGGGDVGGVPGVQPVEDREIVFGAVHHGCPAQVGVDVAGRLLAVPGAHGDRPLGRHHVTAGEHARAAGHHLLVDQHRAVAVELDAGQRAQEPGV